MTQIFEYIKIALMNIRNNKGRSILTMLGIIIGISSVIMIISIGNGMRQEINSELNSIAGGQIALYTNSSVEGNDVSFTEEDFDLIKEKVDHVKGVTANYGVWGTVNAKKGHFEAVVTAGNEALQYIAATEPIVKGRYFNEVEALNGSKVCVISEASAKMLFGTTDVVGMSLEITVWNYTQELKIIGVRADNQSTLINMLGGDGGYVSAEIPMSALASCFGFFTEEFDFFSQWCSAESDSGWKYRF